MNFRLILIYYVLLQMLLSITFAAAVEDYRTIDDRVDTVPVKFKVSIQTMVDYLIEDDYGERDKARAIYMWMIRNITWDKNSVDLFLKTGNRKDLKPNTPESVFKTGKGVCGGFSHLFKKMVNLAGLDAISIFGYYKGAAAYYKGKLGKGPDHAWNAVRIEGKWYLIDAAYGSLFAFEYYFLGEPAHFIRTHFPAKPNYQFLAAPVTREEFEKGASVHAAFFLHQLSDLLPDNQSIQTAKRKTVTVRLKAPETIDVAAAVQAGGKMTDFKVKRTRKGEDIFLTVDFPEKGSYTLLVFSKDKVKNTSYQLAAFYDVQVQ